jgi:hypothetical protein
MEWIISIVTGLVSGLMSGTLTCWYFYRKSGNDLKQEADNLRNLNILIIRALEQAGLAKVSYDADGKPKGLVLELRANIGAVAASGSAASVILHDLKEQSKELNDA